ncbi:MAG: cation diffusion facilitator family transporter, partial [Eubacteriales bacterium]|nr:cation diffusion facilitator family transporter [Eubacteriales bacterium]
MTAWLIQHFVRNYQNTSDHKVRAAYGTLGSCAGILVNVLLAVGKFLAGTLSGSLAITADAVNNLSDAAGSIMSLISTRMADKPMDKEHPFGHGRMEYIGALAVGALIVLAGLQLLRDGIDAIVNPEALSVNALVLTLLAGSILAKLWLFFYYRKIARTIDSATLAAASKDSLSDVLATGTVLLSLVLHLAFDWQIDGWMGVVVALFVLKTGVDVCRDTIDRLLGEKPDPELVKRLRGMLLSYDGILGVHDLVVHDYGPGRRIASVHAEVSAKGDIVAVHELVDKAEREISSELGMALCIHMDPIVTDDPAINGVHEKM